MKIVVNVRLVAQFNEFSRGDSAGATITRLPCNVGLSLDKLRSVRVLMQGSRLVSVAQNGASVSREKRGILPKQCLRESASSANTSKIKFPLFRQSESEVGKIGLAHATNSFSSQMLRRATSENVSLG